jgi:hypothetical protein
MRVLQVTGCAAALLFALGVRPRLSYPLLVVVLLLRTLVLLLRRGVHDWDLPIVTLLALLAVPWANAPPLLQLYRARRDAVVDDRRSYAAGFAIWVPGLTIGLAFAAAAYAKLSYSGVAWITSGAVRYHFVQDGGNAPSGLGLWIAAHPMLSVALALGAVLVEALFIFVVFTSSWRRRALFGAAGLALMTGFYLFQGVRWWPWLIFFAAFLPWQRGQARAGVRQDLTWVHAAVVVLLVGVQVFASAQRLEVEPLVSNYPMYSHTFESPAEFDRWSVRVRFEASGVDITDRVEIADGDNTLHAIARETIERGAPTDASLRELAEFRGAYAERYGELPPAIDVIEVSHPFDWEAGRYLPPTSRRLGAVELAIGIIDKPTRSGGASSDP